MNRLTCFKNIIHRFSCEKVPTLLTVPRFCEQYRTINTFEEPEYLKYLKPQMPYYDLLNIQMKGYDFAVLELFAKYVHHICDHMGLDVSGSWATPHQAFHITTLKHEKKAVLKDKEYDLNLYERNVQVSDLLAIHLPILLEVIQSSMPEGVRVKLHPHDPEYDEFRYIPDLRLMELKQELEEIKHPPKK